jgi:hypothetical protein
VPLKFQLSDWTLCSWKLRLQECEVGLPGVDSAPTALTIPSEPLLPQSAGYFVHSLPVQVEQNVLQHLPGFICYVVSQYRRYYIDLSLGFDAYKKAFSSKTRSTINRKINKFAKFCGGNIQWSMFSDPVEMGRFFELARTVSSRTYQERLLDSGLPQTEEFKAEMMRLSQEGNARGFILFHDDRPVSYLYCPVRNGIVLYAYLGYDPEYAHMSVGTVLHWYAIESLFAEQRFRLFDFTEGQSEHKRVFASFDLLCVNAMFLRHTVGNAILVRLHMLMNRLSYSMGRISEHLGLKSKIKKFLRFGSFR